MKACLLDFWNFREVSYALKFCELHKGGSHFIPQIIIPVGTYKALRKGCLSNEWEKMKKKITFLNSKSTICMLVVKSTSLGGAEPSFCQF